MPKPINTKHMYYRNSTDSTIISASAMISLICSISLSCCVSSISDRTGPLLFSLSHRQHTSPSPSRATLDEENLPNGLPTSTCLASCACSSYCCCCLLANCSLSHALLACVPATGFRQALLLHVHLVPEVASGIQR